MNVQRFIAPTSREAMAKARMAYGDSAVVLSSRSVADGFEVVATAEDRLDQLASQVREQSPEPMAVQSAARQTSGPRTDTVARDTETLAMSTLSFQDYVRERMLRKRREALQGAAASTAVAEPAPPSTPKAAPAGDPLQPRRPLQVVAGEAIARAERSQAAPRAQNAATQSQAAPRAAAPVTAQAAAVRAEARADALAGELQSLKQMIEQRFDAFNWFGQSRQNPAQSAVMLKLIRAGYSPALSRAVLQRMPETVVGDEALRWTQNVLARNLKVIDRSSALCDEGGVFALIGSTGVGKTTTAAKLAAQCVNAYGPSSVGLITLDTYRVGAYEQLRTFGKMLGVVAHQAQDAAALQDLLGLLASKRMVIIDTAGLGQKDPRINDMLEVLAAPGIRKLLVLNACSHGDTLDDILNAYKDKGFDLYGAVISKVDEAAKLGPALDALIRHRIVLRGVATGQRVPEDWQRPDAQALVHLSLGNEGKSVIDPASGELGLYFAQPGGENIQLDEWHA